MDITIVGRHTKISEDLRQKILDKLDKVPVHAPKATSLDVHVVHERNPRISADRERVEITIHDRGVMRVEAGGDDRLVALDAAVAKLTELLRRRHAKRVSRRKNSQPLHTIPVDLPPLPADDDQPPVESVQTWEGAPDDAVREVPLDGTPILIRSKTHQAEPMTVTEAIDQMELVGHDFFLFVDAESGLPSAVYRRRGWTYGVIHLETQESAQRETA